MPRPRRGRLLGRERSTVYKSLHRLVDLGLLTDEWQGGRRLYRLTDFGRESIVRGSSAPASSGAPTTGCVGSEP